MRPSDRTTGLVLLLMAQVLGACLLFVDPPRLDTGLNWTDDGFCYGPNSCPAGMDCYQNSCYVDCDPTLCPNGYTCQVTGEDKYRCEDYCLNDSDCRGGFHCCKDGEIDRGECDYGECAPD